MKHIVVADAGPLIGLARVDQLDLLEKLYHQITVAPRVLDELKLSSDKPGAKIISAATDAGWLKVSQLKKKDDISILNLLVDAGEAESIQLYSITFGRTNQPVAPATKKEKPIIKAHVNFIL